MTITCLSTPLTAMSGTVFTTKIGTCLSGAHNIQFRVKIFWAIWILCNFNSLRNQRSGDLSFPLYFVAL